MGIEYVEYQIKIKNKNTNKEILVHTQLLHEAGDTIYKKEDFEILGLDVTYG